MKIIKILLVITTTGLTQMLFAQNVGIGTNTPAALLHVNGLGTGEGNVLFIGTYKSSNPGNPAASGAGTRMMWYPDKAAFRAGRVTGSQWDIGNIGSLSNAWGDNTTASGSSATAWGGGTSASGFRATAWGFNTIASGSYASAWGSNTNSSNSYATAWGDNTTASGSSATAWGGGTTASGSRATAWGSNTTASALEATAWGSNSSATEYYATAWGLNTNAQGAASTAWGGYTTASGSVATAWGLATIAPSYAETVMGRYNTLYSPTGITGWNSNDRLFVIGNGTSESDRSNAFTVLKNGRTGINLHNPNAQLHINTPEGENGLRVTTNNATRLLFSSNGGLSIGTAISAPSNGLRVAGESYMLDKVNIGSNLAPDATLHIRHSNATAGLMPNQGLRIHNTSGFNRFWTLYTFSSNGALALYSGTGDGVSVGNFNAGTGAYTATSNRHLKTNVLLLGADVLTKIQQLQPATYTYIRDPFHQRTVGFMAEDVQPIFPELVDTVGENGENLAINYAGFSVVAIKAIQELTKQVEELKNELDEVKKLIK